MSDDLVDPGRKARLPWRQINWWLMLIPPAGLLVSVAVSRFDDELFQNLQNDLEVPAPFMVALVSVVYLSRAAIQRNVLFGLLGLLATAMTLREVHDLPGLHFMSKGVYVALGLVVACGVLLVRRVWAALQADWRHTSWLAATFFGYFLALLVMRRAFRSIPGEHHIHRSLEECAETVAHALFIVTSLVAAWRRPPAKTPPA